VAVEADFLVVTANPTSFKKALESKDAALWKNVAQEGIDSIEHHWVWEEMFDIPPSFLQNTWVFQTKPAILSAEE
jgi:hypothetical protein